MSIERTIQWGEHKLRISTGQIARQADSAVVVDLDETVVLVTAVGVKTSDETRDFFPLTVNYQEKTYAAGKIPGGFLKREGRPSEVETLTARLIDRPIRPLFPEGFKNEVQIVATVLSLNPDVSPDIPALIGASAALSFSGMPFKGPIGGIRVGYKDGIYLCNPSKKALEASELDLIVAGTKDAVLMVESEAKELSEQVMLGAVLYGHEMMQSVISVINEMKEAINPTPWVFTPPQVDEALKTNIEGQFTQAIEQAYLIKDKVERKEKLAAIKEDINEAFLSQIEDAAIGQQIGGIVSKLEKRIVRSRILKGEPRIDGRDTKTVRDISVETGLLPRTHGSCLFTRGETQAISVTTLGTDRDAQLIDAIEGERKDRFMLHYNFPPYCVGEVGMAMSPKRREIGHGRLARRALEAVLPKEEDFPYVIRVVSEITESNGSSSMATVCASSLSLMDAGVSISSPVAGIAMGLIKDQDQVAVLTDILGDEDHLGDMDFKVAGTYKGVTALQMDIKIDGITKEIMQEALDQANQARIHILDIMNNKMSKPRETMSPHAPRVVALTINADKIKDVIGKGGATIRSITEEYGVAIDIQDDGTVKIYSSDGEAADKAYKLIKQISSGVQVGEIFEGKIVKIVDFGAFVSLIPGKEGLLHKSQISHDRVNDVSEVLNEGEVIRVKVIDVDRQGRVKLSAKELIEETSETAAGG